jgi:aconitate hydratase
MFRKSYASVFAGDEHWNLIRVPGGKIYAWDNDSTYVKNPPYFDHEHAARAGRRHCRGARAGGAR